MNPASWYKGLDPPLFSDAVRFRPFVGDAYGGRWWRLPLLVLGESHYASDGKPKGTGVTQEVVARFLEGERFPFFSRVTGLLDGPGSARNPKRRRDVWASIAFANYVQEIVGTKPRDRPTPTMWADARGPFLEVLHVLRPRAVLVLGKDLWNHLPPADAPGPTLNLLAGPEQARWYGQAIAAHVAHPASFGFSYKNWGPVLPALIAEASGLPS